MICQLAKDKLGIRLIKNKLESGIKRARIKYCVNGICPMCGENKQIDKGSIIYDDVCESFWFECYKCKFKMNW